ncbi:hypothetical protein KS884_004453 [Vibrio parahaemolyticus]|nr:hypothetical protein [Vibrio parahaemolyticus]
MPDTWSLITGVVGLLSFLMAVNDKFANLKRFTIPLACALVGFAVGRLSYVGAMGSVSSDGSLGVISIIVVTLLVITAITYLFIKVGQDGFAYIVFIMGATMLPSKFVDSYNNSMDKLSYNDYIQLSQVKLSNSDYDSAIRLLKLAKEKADNSVVKTEISSRIDEVYKKSVSL